MSSMITTSAWVRRGVAAQFPTKYEIDEKEMDRISKLARMQLEDAREDLSAAQGNGPVVDKDEDAMEEDNVEKDNKKDAPVKM
jgi:periodic tryptophan protein 1